MMIMMLPLIIIMGVGKMVIIMMKLNPLIWTKRENEGKKSE